MSYVSNGTEWTELETDLLKRFLKAGLSYSQISRKLQGRNRDMVAGKANRLRGYKRLDNPDASFK